MAKCTNCLLPETVPGADINAEGICGCCRQYASADHEQEEQLRKQREADLEKALESCRGQAQYDCLVNLSGGKDSCYLLHKIKREYGLNCLAFTVNLNIPDVAWKNIHRTIEKLEVPHISFTPPGAFYHKMFRFLLKNQEARGAVRTVCYACAPLTEGYSLQLAMEKGIPLILAGYSPGQPDPERMVYEFSREMICQTDWTPQVLRESGQFEASELDLYWNPFRYPSEAKFPRYLAPFHAWRYSQADTMKLVVELGLVSNSRHASPVLSNCPLNWLLMYSDLKNLGYNSYQHEFSSLIRQGKASRWYWRIMGPVVNVMIRRRIFLGRNVTRSLRQLELGPQDLRITRPAEPAEGGERPEPTADGQRPVTEPGASSH